MCVFLGVRSSLSRGSAVCIRCISDGRSGALWLATRAAEKCDSNLYLLEEERSGRGPNGAFWLSTDCLLRVAKFGLVSALFLTIEAFMVDRRSEPRLLSDGLFCNLLRAGPSAVGPIPISTCFMQAPDSKRLRCNVLTFRSYVVLRRRFRGS